MTTATKKQTFTNIYTVDGAWYGARWVDGEYDGCDDLDTDSETEARKAARFIMDAPVYRVVSPGEVYC